MTELQIIGVALMVLGIIGVGIFGFIHTIKWDDISHKLMWWCIGVYFVGWVLSWVLQILN